MVIEKMVVGGSPVASAEVQEHSYQVWAETERSLLLAERLVSELKQKGLYITTVESCTGGGLAYYITNIPGASEVMKDSFVTYSNEAKISLGVPEAVIAEFTVYSEETARAMAEAGFLKSVKADICVGITGSISRSDPSNPNSTPGIIYIGIKYGDRIVSQTLEISDERRFDVKQKIIEKTLEIILDMMIKPVSISSNDQI